MSATDVVYFLQPRWTPSRRFSKARIVAHEQSFRDWLARNFHLTVTSEMKRAGYE